MKYLFIGNRRFVLEELLQKTKNVKIACIGGTHLERDPFLNDLSSVVVNSSAQVHDLISTSDFDILVSNGLPYKLDLKSLPDRQYINIHPSYLPDLRGIDPVLGAILFQRDGGATCHYMNDKFDDGDIISQVKIPFTEDLTASLLYQLSFMAEKQCFNLAWNRSFKILAPQIKLDNAIYFSRTPETRVLNFNSSNEDLLQTIKAFDNSNQGARFKVGNEELKCHAGWFSTNPFLVENFKKHAANEIVLIYEDTLVIKRKDGFIFLSEVSPMNSGLIGKVVE